MNPFLVPFRLFAESLNLLPGVRASVREEHVRVADREAGGRRVLLVRGRDAERTRATVKGIRDGDPAAPRPLVRFDVAPEGDSATVVTDDPGATVSLDRHAVTVEAEGARERFDLPFDPVAADRQVSNGVLTVDIE